MLFNIAAWHLPASDLRLAVAFLTIRATHSEPLMVSDPGNFRWGSKWFRSARLNDAAAAQATVILHIAFLASTAAAAITVVPADKRHAKSTS